MSAAASTGRWWAPSLPRSRRPTMKQMLRSRHHGSQVKYSQLRRSRPPSHADQSAVLPQLAPLTDYQKSNQVASEDALSRTRSHDAVSCKSLRGIWTFSDLRCQSPNKKIAEDEDDRIIKPVLQRPSACCELG